MVANEQSSEIIKSNCFTCSLCIGSVFIVLVLLVTASYIFYFYFGAGKGYAIAIIPLNEMAFTMEKYKSPIISGINDQSLSWTKSSSKGKNSISQSRKYKTDVSIFSVDKKFKNGKNAKKAITKQHIKTPLKQLKEKKIQKDKEKMKLIKTNIKNKNKKQLINPQQNVKETSKSISSSESSNGKSVKPQNSVVSDYVNISVTSGLIDS